MAKIPDYSGRTVNIAQIGTPRLSMNAPDASGLTRGLQQAENGISDAIIKAQNDAKNAALSEADSKLNDWKTRTLFDPEVGVYNLKGQNATNVVNETLPMFDKQVEEIMGGIQNEDVKARFREVAQRHRDSFNLDMNKYEFHETQVAQNEIDASRQASYAQTAVLNYNNPKAIGESLGHGLLSLDSQAQRNGWPAEKTAIEKQKYVSGIHLATIDRLMTENPSEALTRFASVKGAMTPEDQARVEKVLVPQMQKQRGAATVDALLSGNSLDYRMYMPALFGQESNNRQLNSDGTPVTSEKGATGKGQIMQKTGPEAAALAGLQWDENKFKYDVVYNEALSEAYLREQFRAFQDPALALAAYNAGAGSVRQAIRAVGDPRTGEATYDQFLNALPKPEETKPYVTNILKNTPQARQGTPAEGSARFAEVRTEIQKMPAGAEKEAALKQLKGYEDAEDAREAALYDQAAEQVKTAGYDSLTPEMIRSLPADSLGKLVTLDKKLREGVPSTTTPGKLDEFLTMPPTKLGGLSLERDIRPFLSDRDYTTVQSAWQAARKGDGSVQGVAKAENENLNFVMNKAEILTGSSEDATKPENLKKQDQFRAAYNARRDAFVSANKREPTLDEARGLAEMLLLDVKLKGVGTLWGDSGIKLWEAQPEDTVYLSGDMSIDAVPAMERMTIVKELRDNKVQPSEEMIIAAYQEKLRANQLEIK